MGLKTAAAAQYFGSSEFTRARIAMRALFVLLGITAAAAVAIPEQGILAIAAGIVGLALSLMVRVRGRAFVKNGRNAVTFWNANSFSFLLMGGLLIPGGIYLNEYAAARFVVSGVAALALLAGVVGFCAGRFIYLLVFPTVSATEGA